MDVLTILLLSTHKLLLSFQFCVSSSNFFFTFSYRSVISMVKFIPRYFTLLDAVVNGTAFLISVSDNSLSVCRNQLDFVH